MKTPWLALAAAVLCAQPLFAAWQQELTPNAGKFPALRSFRAHYRFGWGMVTAAEADMDYQVDRGAGVARLKADAHSVGMVRTLWRMDTQHASGVTLATLRPIGLSQTEAYSDETIKTTLQFTPEGVNRTRQGMKPGAPPARTKQFKFPGVFELVSGLEFIRSQRLVAGDIYRMVVYPTTAPYLAQVNVVGRQNVKVNGQQRPALRLDLKLWKVDKDLKLEAHDKFKRATAYFSDDSDRMLLRVEGEVHVGSVWGELEKIEWK